MEYPVIPVFLRKGKKQSLVFKRGSRNYDGLGGWLVKSFVSEWKVSPALEIEWPPIVLLSGPRDINGLKLYLKFLLMLWFLIGRKVSCFVAFPVLWFRLELWWFAAQFSRYPHLCPLSSLRNPPERNPVLGPVLL